MVKNKYKINLEKDRAIINVLGEICCGFQTESFEVKIGARKEIVEALLERLMREEKSGITEAYLIDSEIELIKMALKEVEKEIAEWEFQTRIGISIKEVNEIIDELERP